MTNQTSTVWTIVVAGGSGNRFGGLKQAALLDGRRVVDHAVQTACTVSEGVVLVVPADGSLTDPPPGCTVVAGGSSRSRSVRNGLAAVPADAGIVLVHDAARPLTTRATFDRVVAAVRDGADAAIPGLPVADTIKRVVDDVVDATVDRTGLVAVQTPQAFRADLLRAAHATGLEGTDDAAILEATGAKIQVVSGDERNRKLTTPEDLAILHAYLIADRAVANDQEAG